MLTLWTPEQIRNAEAPLLQACQEAGDPDRLMRRAAHGLEALVARALSRRPALPEPTVPGPYHLAGTQRSPKVQRVGGTSIVGLIGPGNNGGDGLYALAGLAARGARCSAVLLAERWHERAAAAADAAGVELVSSTHHAMAGLMESADVVLDAALGIGAHGGMDMPGWNAEQRRWAIEAVPMSAWVVAVDSPSGLDNAAGAADQHVPIADATVTFGAVTPGLVVGAGRSVAGDVYLVDVGLGEAPAVDAPKAAADGPPAPQLMTANDARARLLEPGPGDHKYSRGVLGLVAGSPAYPGAAILSGKAALQTGMGMLAAFTRGQSGDHMITAIPEAVIAQRSALAEAEWPVPAQKSTAWVVGPGLGEDTADLGSAREVLKRTPAPVVVDASALPLWEPSYARDAAGEWRPRVLTPHAGEFKRLAQQLGIHTADPLENPIQAARELAAGADALVLQKGSATVVAAPTGEVTIAASAPPTLARAGSGDELAGTLGAMLATHAGRRKDQALSASFCIEVTAAAAVVHGLRG